MKEENYTVGDIILYGCVVCGILFALPFFFVEEPKYLSLIILKSVAMLPIMFLYFFSLRVFCGLAYRALMSAFYNSADGENGAGSGGGTSKRDALVSFGAFIIIGFGFSASLGWVFESNNPHHIFIGKVAVVASWAILLIFSMWRPTIRMWCEGEKTEST